MMRAADNDDGTLDLATTDRGKLEKYILIQGKLIFLSVLPFFPREEPIGRRSI